MKNKVLLNNTLSLPTGRFAPSPSGELHLGSLVAATASYLNVKQQQGRWLLRIDDIDPLRVQSNSQDHILMTLEGYGFMWDQLIVQSQRHEHYQAALMHLKNNNQLYCCDCSRRQVQQRTQRSGYYDNYCRFRQINEATTCSWRIITPSSADHWYDAIQGPQCFDWQAETGDFIVYRSDHVCSYHLACAVDDADFGITEVIRGADLLASTAPQRYLQAQLNQSSPTYAHHPLLIDPNTGIKLSKAARTDPIQIRDAIPNLITVLNALGQQPPNTLHKSTLSDVWQWAIEHWQLSTIPRLSA